MKSDAGIVVETVGLTKRYGESLAVNDLNFVVCTGTSVGLLGPNGAGKSTTIKMLLGLVQPTSGSSAIYGIDSAHDGVALRSRVGYVPERQHIYGWMTDADILRFVRPYYRDYPDRLRLSLYDTPRPTHDLATEPLVEGCHWLIEMLGNDAP